MERVGDPTVIPERSGRWSTLRSRSAMAGRRGTRPRRRQVRRPSLTRISIGLFVLALLSAGWLAFITTAPALALGKRVLIVAPHPDDDILYGAGVAANALAAGDTVKIVYMTNGDYTGTDVGLLRQDRAVSAQTSFIGTSEDDLIFLGYPDNYLGDIYWNYPGSAYLTTEWDQSETYGVRGLENRTWHKYRFGSEAFYNLPSIMQDLESILQDYAPTDIYTTSAIDDHYDHAMTHGFVREAIRVRMAADVTYTPVLHTTIVWWAAGSWPALIDPTALMVEPPGFSDASGGLLWSDRESLEVPAAMQLAGGDLPSNPKYQAIAIHGDGPFLNSFVHKDEVFWIEALNSPPAANAGPPQLVTELTLVQLNGSASSDPDSDLLSYSWTQTGGMGVTLSGATTAQPSFTAPAGLGSLTFELVVNDGRVNSSPASVTITVANIAALATVTASSENGATDQLAVKAVDGFADGYGGSPGEFWREWASSNETVGAWLELDWSSSRNPIRHKASRQSVPRFFVVDRIVLYDRPNAYDQITAATLLFSDGSSLPTGTLPDDGSPLTLDFPARMICGVQLIVTATSPTTNNIGLAEFAVYGHELSAADTATVTPSAGPNGTISPDATQTVPAASRPSFVMTPAVGYHVADVLVDGASVGAVSNYTFGPIYGPHTIEASFAIDTFAITVTSGANGSVTPGTGPVDYGSSPVYTITPAPGYHVADVLVDGESVGPVDSYTFVTVSATHSIEASFAID